MATTNKKKQPKTKKTATKVKKEVVVNQPPPPIDSAWRIIISSAQVLWRNKGLFSGVMLVYGVAYIILVQGLSVSGNVSNIRSQFSGVFHGHLSHLFTGLSTFAQLVGTSNSSSTPSSSTYQGLLILIVSLVLIWCLRQVYAGTKLRVRDGYYKGLYPLIPFILVVIVIAIELVPLVIGSTLYNIVISEGVAVYAIEKVIWIIIILALAALSLYLTSSSIFALYIVTLPDMTPMKALRSARGLVKRRRLIIIRKLLFLVLVLVVVAAVIMLPFILALPGVAVWVFFILSLIAIATIHSYLYNLYRELIK